jgi:hypothetical protein
MSETSNDCEACAAMERAGAPRELARAAHQADTVRATPLPEADDEEMAERLCEAAALDAAEGMTTDGGADFDLQAGGPPAAIEQPDAHAQALPVPNGRPAIVDLVLARLRSPRARAVIETRDAIGRGRYGTRLQAFNGRDVERDLTDEAADAVNYAMQGIEEAPDEGARARWERRFAMAVALLEEAVCDEQSDRSGARILALAGEHDVITADELPRVLASIEEARNGPVSGPWCENCGDAFDGPERDCPQPAPGEPLKQCGRGGHMFRLERPPVVVLTPGSTWTGPDGTVYDVVRPEEVGERARWWLGHLAIDAPGWLPDGLSDLHDDPLYDPLDTTCTAALVVSRDIKPDNVTGEVRIDGEQAGKPTKPWPTVRGLEADRDQWRRLAGERADAIAGLEGEVERLRAQVSGLELDVSAMEARGDSHVETSARLETERNAWRADYAGLAEAIEAHLPYIESDGHGAQVARIANAGAVIDATARDRDEHRRQLEHLRARLHDVIGYPSITDAELVAAIAGFHAQLGIVTDRSQEIADKLAGGQPTAGPVENLARIASSNARDRDRAREIAAALGANLPPPDALGDDVGDALLRISCGVADLQRDHDKAVNSRDHWRAKAKRLSEGARRGVVGSGGTEDRRAHGDHGTWSSSAGGGTKRKRGKIVEVVAPGKFAKTRSARGDRYYGTRKHAWYVVDVDGEIYYPRAAGLRRAKGKR